MKRVILFICFAFSVAMAQGQVKGYTVEAKDYMILQGDTIRLDGATNGQYLKRVDGVWTNEEGGGASGGGIIANLYLSYVDNTYYPSYKTLSYVNDATETIETLTVSSGTSPVYGHTYLYTDELGVTSISAGLWTLDLWAILSNDGDETVLGGEVFLLHSDNSTTDLFSTETPDINNETNYTHVATTTWQPEYLCATTDRLGVRAFASTTRGGDVDVSVKIGSTYGAYMGTPLSLRHDLLRDKNENPDFQHVTMEEREQIQKNKQISDSVGVFIIDDGNEGYTSKYRAENPDNYADIGYNAVDLSFSTGASTSHGARGNYSNALGQNTTANSFIESARGFNNYSPTANSVSSWDDADVIESVGGGNASPTSCRDNLLTRWKNGSWLWSNDTLSNITTAIKGVHAVDTTGQLNYYNGSNWVKYTAEGSADLQTVTDNGSTTTNIITVDNTEEITDKAKHKVIFNDGTGIQFRHQFGYWDGSTWLTNDGYGTGTNAIKNNTGINSNGFGFAALMNNTGTSSNGFGFEALRDNTADYVNGFGYAALANNTGISSNGFGFGALQDNTGDGSNGFGGYALFNNTGSYSNGFGYRSLYSNTGANNTAIGHDAGYTTTDFNYNNCTMLGANSLATKNNQVVLGDDNVTEVYTTGVVKCADGVDGDDAATMSQLPNVSNLATKTALADSTAQVRSEIQDLNTQTLQTVTDNGSTTTNILTVDNEEVVTDKAKHRVVFNDGTDIQFRHQTSYWNGSAWTATIGYGLGDAALSSNTGSNSNGFGASALQSNTGSNSNGFGHAALMNNMGINSSGFGYTALQNNTGAFSSGFGYAALSFNTGSNSNGLGAYALQKNTGYNSNGFGHAALSANTGAYSNGFGAYALQGNTGSNSNGFGAFALQYNTGDNNTAVGYLAGYKSSTDTLRVSNSTMLGANSWATKDNQVVLGDDNVVEVYSTGILKIDKEEVETGYAKHKVVFDDGTGVQFRHQTSYWDGSAWQDDNSYGIGTDALLDNKGTYSCGFGHQALYSNDGAFSNGFGALALSGNTGTQSDGFGSYALFSNSGAASCGFGHQSLYSNSGDYSNGFGFCALHNNEGINSNGLGCAALEYNTGSYSNGLGYRALRYNTGDGASGLGNRVLYKNTGDNNTAVGYLAGYTTTDFNYANCTMLGANSLATKDNQVVLGDSNVEEVYTTGIIKVDNEEIVTDKAKHKVVFNDGTGIVFRHQTAYWDGSAWQSSSSCGIGMGTLQSNTGYHTNGFGDWALHANTGSYSNGFGHYALCNNTGTYSNGFGGSALQSNTGSNSNGFGSSALSANTGSFSNGFGNYTLQNNTGDNNSAFGHNAGYTISTFNYSNCTMLGANSLATKSNQVVLGDDNVTEVYTAGAIVCQSVTETSDSTMKQDIAPIDTLMWVDSLDFRQFRFKRDTTRLHYGIIAQQLQELNKELVVENNGKLGVDYTGLLISIVARQREQIDSLQDNISIMRSDIEELKQLINDLNK
jgi:hypothetical protein